MVTDRPGRRRRAPARGSRRTSPSVGATGPRAAGEPIAAGRGRRWHRGSASSARSRRRPASAAHGAIADSRCTRRSLASARASARPGRRIKRRDGRVHAAVAAAGSSRSQRSPQTAVAVLAASASGRRSQPLRSGVRRAKMTVIARQLRSRLTSSTDCDPRRWPERRAPCASRADRLIAAGRTPAFGRLTTLIGGHGRRMIRLGGGDLSCASIAGIDR